MNSCFNPFEEMKAGRYQFSEKLGFGRFDNCYYESMDDGNLFCLYFCSDPIARIIDKLHAGCFVPLDNHINAWHTANETSKCVDYAQLSAKNAGYIPYYLYRQKNTVDNLENVGFALPGTEGLYNIYMMEEIHSIFAVGAGAVSKMVSRDGATIERIFEYKYPYEYLAETSGVRNEEKAKKIIEFYRNLW